MSKSTSPDTPPTDAPTAEEIYDEHGDAVDEFAERDDIVGALARAIRNRAGVDDD